MREERIFTLKCVASANVAPWISEIATWAVDEISRLTKALDGWNDLYKEFRDSNSKPLATEIARLKETVCFFACVIKSGEGWTDTCEQRYRAIFPKDEWRMKYGEVLWHGDAPIGDTFDGEGQPRAPGVEDADETDRSMEETPLLAEMERQAALGEKDDATRLGDPDCAGSGTDDRVSSARCCLVARLRAIPQDHDNGPYWDDIQAAADALEQIGQHATHLETIVNAALKQLRGEET